MKKIVHIQVLPKMSGVQQISLDIMKGLDSSYEKYIVFGGKEHDKSVDDAFSELGVKVVYIESLKREICLSDFKAFYDLIKFFREYSFDIVHTNSSKPGIVARIAAKIAGVDRIVHTVHGISFHKHESLVKRVIYYFVELFSCFFGDMNVTVNKFYMKYYPSCVIKSVSIYNGVDFSKLDESIFKPKPYCDNEVTVAFFARLDVQKDPISYIKIVHYIISNKLCSKGVKFILAGSGELEHECLSLINELGLKENLTYVGWVLNKSEFLSRVDILCQPSKWEAFGLNIVEAAHFSIPTVASRVEGIPEVILDGETGILCEQGDLASFANSVSRLVNSDELRYKLGARAKIFVNNSFLVENMQLSYKSIYEADS